MTRTALAFALTATVALAACGDSAEAPAGDAAADASGGEEVLTAAPARKSGLWSQKIAEMGMDMSMCVDAATDNAAAAASGMPAGTEGCTPGEFSRTAGGVTFTNRCVIDGVTTESTGRITGDFERRYAMKVDTVTSGSPYPEVNGTRTLTVEAEYQGPCPAGMNPGDTMLPGGMILPTGKMTGG